VWPTKAREFTVATHWEVMEHGNNNNNEPTEQSIMILSFSCNEANNMHPNVSSQFVRANLFVSLYILQPVSVMVGTEMKIHCQFTRLLSFDLAGNIPQQLSNAITNQQANLPAVISDYLHNNPLDFEPRDHDENGKVLSNELLVSSVINQLRESHIDDNNTDNNASGAGESSIATVPSKDTHTPSYSHTLPSWKVQLITFLAPIFVHWAIVSVHMTGSGLIFCIVTFVVLRTVVIWHTGDEIISKQPNPSIVSHVTCRLRIDLKGILRYISNKNEERDEMRSRRASISAIHIVASALAHGLKKEPLLLTRKVSIPWLFIRRVVDASNEPIDISISENGGDIVTVTAVDRRTIQQIADCQKHTDCIGRVGRCLILAMSNYNEGDMTTDAAPMHEEVTVVAVLGGVHLERNGTVHSQVNPKPYLNISLTISGTHQSVDLVTCRRFADEVRKLLLYPEICENMYNGTPLKLKCA
jgi:START domain